jgi:dehydrogenase/reductase SDR family protein 12
MARYIDAIDLPIPVDDAFEYLADFSRTAEWDPGVSDAQRITRGPIRLGTRFRVVVSVLGLGIPLEYRITEFDRPSRLVLSGGDRSVRSVDEITFASRHGGTRITYEARVELTGIRRLADPILDVLLQRAGRMAVRGLRERMASPDLRKTDDESQITKVKPRNRYQSQGRSSSQARIDDQSKGVA